MAALDGKITIERELRPCRIYNPQSIGEREAGVDVSEYLSDKNKRYAIGLFHCWCYHKNPLGENSPYGKSTTVSHMFGVIEFENGCVKEIPLWQIRFVDNAMSEYVFPEAKESREKSEDEWKTLKRVGYVCPKCGQGTMKLDEGIVLTSNPPQYRLKCDKCGHIEYSGIKYNISDNYG